MLDNINIGAGNPDIPASAGTTETLMQDSILTDASNADVSSVVEPIRDEAIPQEKDGQKTEADIAAEMEALSKEEPTDTDVIKKLRSLVKTKYEDFVSKAQPQTSQVDLSEAQKQKLELAEELFKFDLEAGEPTTKGFAEKLASQDITVANRALVDLAAVPMDKPGAQGWTLGHEFLSQIGLDPYKLEELRQYSRGEITGESLGIKSVPDFIPNEYREAYSQLPDVLKADTDLYMGPQGSPAQKAAAIQMLSDKQAGINQINQYNQQAQIAQQEFENGIVNEVESQLTTTYTGLLDTIKTNPAFTQVKLSSNETVDLSMKNSIISQITALGDPRSLLASQAVKNLESLGVKVEVDKVNAYMAEIEKQTELAVRAEALGKKRGQDYSIHVQEALSKRSDAIARAIALGNKYFSEALATASGQSNVPSPVGAIPALQGGVPAPSVVPSGQYKTEKEFEAHILQVAQNIANSNASG